MALRFLNSGYFAGKVGIGTETPTAPLDVFGVRAGRDWALTNRAVIRLDSNGAGFPSDILFGHTAAANQTSWTGVYWSLSSRGSSDAGKFHFYRGNGHDSPYSSEAVIMTFDPNLNVGIGTTSPGVKLDVSGVTKTDSILINATSPIASSIVTLNKASTSTGTDVGQFYDITKENTTDSTTSVIYGVVNRVDSTSAFENRGIITQNNIGRVTGTGDFSYVYPSYNQSSIKGTGTVDYAVGGYNEASLNNASGTVNNLWGTHTEVQLTAGTAGEISLLNFDFDQSAGTTITGDFQYINISNDQPVLNISGTARALNIESDLPSFFSGSIGIGTSSPSYKLTAYGSSTDSEIVASFGSANDANEYTAIGLSGFIASNGATKAGLALKRTGTYGTGELHFLNNNTLDNSDMTLSDSKMMINSSGNVGIGTTSPDFKLDVNGIIRSENSSEVGTLYLGNTAQSQIPGGAIIGQRSPSYSSTGNLLFQVPTWGAGTDYGLTTQMSIEVSTSDTKKATISMIPFGGNVEITNALLSNQSNTNVDTGAEVVAQVSTSTYTAAFFDFVIKKVGNIRSGTVYACHDGTNVEFTETSTNDLGDTSDVTLSVDKSGTNLRLIATVTSDDWIIKSLIRAI